MPMPERRWTVSCARCDVLVGIVDGGRFIHNPDCAHPLAISGGTMRCCGCGGELTVTEQPVLSTLDELDDEDADFEDVPNVRRLSPEPLELRRREARRGH
jgi:hypothetical protein